MKFNTPYLAGFKPAIVSQPAQPKMKLMRAIRTHSSYTLVIVILFLSFQAAGQIRLGKALAKAKDVVGNVGTEPWKPGAAITTSIKDTLYGFPWLDGNYLSTEDADTISSFDLKPGHYKARIRSYCLHAGVYGPSKGDGYQIARLKGTKANLVRNILSRSAEYPQIDQHDVQRLIWGIESGLQFSAYPPDFQFRVKPLLTEVEILAMQVNVSKAAGRAVPAELKEIAATYASLRGKLQSSQTTYDEIESIAVKTGIPPLGFGSKVINAGVWSYIGDGFFMKATPISYPRTDIEIYRPSAPVVRKDARGRTSSYDYNGYKVELVYNDAPGNDHFNIEGRQVPVWKIRGYRLTGQAAGQQLDLNVDDWIFRGTFDEFSKLVTTDMVANTQSGAGPSAPDEMQTATGPVWEDIKARYDRIKKWIDRYKEYQGYADEIEDVRNPPSPDEYLNEAAVNENIYEGLKAALNPIDKKGQSAWIRKNLRMTLDLMFSAICQLRGGCENNDPRRPDLPGHPAQPGNTSRQRIGLSPYQEKN